MKGNCQERWDGFFPAWALSWSSRNPSQVGICGSGTPGILLLVPQKLELGWGVVSHLSHTHRGVGSIPSVGGKCSVDRNFLDLVWLCGGVPACSHTGKRQELSSYPWCPTAQGVFDLLFLPSAPQVLLTSDLTPPPPPQSSLAGGTTCLLPRSQM